MFSWAAGRGGSQHPSGKLRRMPRARSLSPWVAAGLLALLTLFVFFTLQHYGPESAIRRFHRGAMRRDRAELAEVTLQSPDHPAARLLAVFVLRSVAPGVRREFGSVYREPRHAEVEVIYRHPAGVSVASVWIVRKPERHGRWLVDAERTLRLWRQAAGG